MIRIPLNIVIYLLLICTVSRTSAQTQEGRGKRVTLDYYYNNEHKKDEAGNLVRWHYIWDEQDNGGFSYWGKIFNKYGVQTDSLLEAPTKKNLSNTDIYIIVDPDTDKENPSPNYMNNRDAEAIYNWVKAGGVLVMLENDSLNAEFDHFNILAEKFGIHFNGDSRNRVQGRHFEQGAFMIPAGHEIFAGIKKVYIKELSSLTLKAPARAVYKDGEHVIMAVSRVGKGTVFAVGDPWFYNEYVNGKLLSADYENLQAADALTRWLIKQCKR
ncbi:hypothetical protein J2T02_001675 [Chitinophaga terrae (ex Kim and Jung 2007)]|uniref:DUF4350 domain-containing protein n=1 Tax=Chitinophaga terrae (ex Kim and Jung 2007) TaxID=408074 RepID=UPI00278155BE|nr:hypothetical protein [Chitinophaga terrae (ex Kim and Jung 2007)]MDQ0106564.1 hypothetical protein [Chitinophaga terrae (ex Kim and Jung 2007)]